MASTQGTMSHERRCHQPRALRTGLCVVAGSSTRACAECNEPACNAVGNGPACNEPNELRPLHPSLSHSWRLHRPPHPQTHQQAHHVRSWRLIGQASDTPPKNTEQRTAVVTQSNEQGRRHVWHLAPPRRAGLALNLNEHSCMQGAERHSSGGGGSVRVAYGHPCNQSIELRARVGIGCRVWEWTTSCNAIERPA